MAFASRTWTTAGRVGNLPIKPILAMLLLVAILAAAAGPLALVLSLVALMAVAAVVVAVRMQPDRAAPKPEVVARRRA